MTPTGPWRRSSRMLLPSTTTPLRKKAVGNLQPSRWFEPCATHCSMQVIAPKWTMTATSGSKMRMANSISMRWSFNHQHRLRTITVSGSLKDVQFASAWSGTASVAFLARLKRDAGDCLSIEKSSRQVRHCGTEPQSASASSLTTLANLSGLLGGFSLFGKLNWLKRVLKETVD